MKKEIQKKVSQTNAYGTPRESFLKWKKQVCGKSSMEIAQRPQQLPTQSFS